MRRETETMSHINVTINGRQYRMACEEGQEVRLLRLAESLESRVESAARQVRRDRRCAADRDGGADGVRRIARCQPRIRSLEEELDGLRDVRVAAVDRAKATQAAVANALNAAAERIERDHAGAEPHHWRRGGDRVTNARPLTLAVWFAIVVTLASRGCVARQEPYIPGALSIL